MNNIEVDFKDEFSVHGQDIVRFYDGVCVAGQALAWPDPNNDSSGIRSKEPIIARLDGVIVGRAFMEAELYPLAELQNFVVAPYARRKGVGHAIVQDIITRTSELGYLALHLQTELDNVAAQSLYKAHGFLPAQQGEMLRMVRFLNYPLLNSFLESHLLVRFDSRRSESYQDLWMLEWKDFLNSDTLAIYLSSGSCQGDSGGFAPGVSRVHYRTSDLTYEVKIECPDTVEKNREFELCIKIANKGATELVGDVRLMLNQGFAPGADSSGAMKINIGADSHEEFILPVMMTDAFNTDFWKNTAYPSVGVGLEVFINQQCFWLAAQTKMHSS